MALFRLTRSYMQSRIGATSLSSTLLRSFSTEKEFKEKLQIGKSLPPLEDNMKKLEMYALYKQSTEGENRTSKPGMLDFVGKAKWEAWSKLGDMSKEDAMKSYIAMIENLEKEAGLGGGNNTADDSEATSSSTSDDIIITKSDNGLLTITLNRPKKFNAIRMEMYTDITNALNSASKDTSVRAVLLQSKGKMFSSGNDLSMFMNIPPEGPEKLASDGQILLENFVNAFIEFPKPLAAKVQGPAIGISVTLLALCDFVYASEHATFMTPFTSIGQSPEACSSVLFPEIMGSARANSMLLLGEKLTAKEAEACGFVSGCFGEDLDEQVRNKMEKLVSLPPNSMIQSKKLIRAPKLETLKEINRKESKLLEKLWISPESVEAAMKFAARKN